MYEIALISQTLRCMSSEILRNGLVKHPSLAGLPPSSGAQGFNLSNIICPRCTGARHRISYPPTFLLKSLAVFWKAKPISVWNGAPQARSAC